MTDSAQAQPLLPGRQQHGLAPTVASIDFSYAGDNAPEARYDYGGIAYGLTYSNRGSRFMILFGRADPGHSVMSVSLSTWGFVSFANVVRRQTRLGIPLGVMVTARRVTEGGSGREAYRASNIGLGIGGALQHMLNRRTILYARVSPFAGITTSPLVDLVGFSWLTEADLQLEMEEVFRGIGLILGYSFRYQFWNLNGSGPFSESVDKNLDYRGFDHVLRAGIKL